MASAVPTPRAQPQPPLRATPQRRRRVAFVCWGNSCRSQMAEGWARHLSQNSVEAVSAGISALGFIAPETLQVMEEKKVSLAGQKSKGLKAIDWPQVDVLVNMAPVPTEEVVPEFQGRRLEWHVEDPYGEPLETFREVRDELEGRVRALLAELGTPSGGSVAPPVA